MSIYKKTIGLTGLITILSFVVCLVLHYLFMSEEAEFWCNVVLGIFSGALLTLLSSVIGYRVERKRVLENFFYYTNKILKQINQYQMNMTLEEKINFLLEYADSDKIEWDSCLGEIDFLFDFGKKILNTFIIRYINHYGSYRGQYKSIIGILNGTKTVRVKMTKLWRNF